MMTSPSPAPILDPISRLTEILFGLLMTLTFTGTMSVALGSGDNVRNILFAALGCNLAWGIVDATIYVLVSVVERGQTLAQLREIKRADTDESRRRIRSFLPDATAKIMTDADIDRLADGIKGLPADDRDARVVRHDLLAAGMIFLLVVAATIPPSIPFLIVDNVHLAMRLSNAIAILMLFLIGWKLDAFIGERRFPMRIVVPLIGSVLVATTIALGG